MLHKKSNRYSNNAFLTINKKKQNFKNVSKFKIASIIIGIVTVERQKETYLFKTLRSLFQAMTDDDKKNVLIVVEIAEVFYFKLNLLIAIFLTILILLNYF